MSRGTRKLQNRCCNDRFDECIPGDFGHPEKRPLRCSHFRDILTSTRLTPHHLPPGVLLQGIEESSIEAVRTIQGLVPIQKVVKDTILKGETTRRTTKCWNRKQNHPHQAVSSAIAPLYELQKKQRSQPQLVRRVHHLLNNAISTTNLGTASKSTN